VGGDILHWLAWVLRYERFFDYWGRHDGVWCFDDAVAILWEGQIAPTVNRFPLVMCMLREENEA